MLLQIYFEVTDANAQAFEQMYEDVYDAGADGVSRIPTAAHVSARR